MKPTTMLQSLPTRLFFQRDSRPLTIAAAKLLAIFLVFPSGNGFPCGVSREKCQLKPRSRVQGRSVVIGALLDGDSNHADDAPRKRNNLGSLVRRGLLVSTVLAFAQYSFANGYSSAAGFQRTPTQFIAALGDPDSSGGSGAENWGLWRLDPGPRGVFLRDFERSLAARNNVAPAGWKYNPNDWWVEEHGLIMEAPDFPVPAGRYLVTGGRQVTTVLEIDGGGNWRLDEGKLFDVTHLPCRSARYRPIPGVNGGSPSSARLSDFPVSPGAEMPPVPGCNKQDYAVLFLIGIDNGTVKQSNEL
jgi:hypothetical protein